MNVDWKIKQIIDIGWTSYKNKVASELLSPHNEKMMQLQLAQTFQTLLPIFEYDKEESIKLLLEVPVQINRQPSKRIIDIVISYSHGTSKMMYPIELKCFRQFTRESSDKKRGGQNLGMYDYWEDIENIEQYSLLQGYSFGTHLALTDDMYYVTGKHEGKQVSVFSTNNSRLNVTGVLSQPIANRLGKIELQKYYSMTEWEKVGDYHFIRQYTQ